MTSRRGKTYLCRFENLSFTAHTFPPMRRTSCLTGIVFIYLTPPSCQKPHSNSSHGFAPQTPLPMWTFNNPLKPCFFWRKTWPCTPSTSRVDSWGSLTWVGLETWLSNGFWGQLRRLLVGSIRLSKREEASGSRWTSRGQLKEGWPCMPTDGS